MESSNKINTLCLFTLTMIAIATALIYTKSIMIPFVLSLFIYFIISPVMLFLQKKTKLNRSTSLILTLLLFFTFIIVTFSILNSSISNFLSEIDIYKGKIKDLKILLINFASNFGVEINSQYLMDTIENAPIGSLFKRFTQSILSLVSSSFLVIIFTIFFLAGESADKTNSTLVEIKRSISKYVSIKLILSLLTGGLTYLIFLIFNIELAFMFALLTFILNFIPNIGSIIAVALPVPIMFLQFSLNWKLVLSFSLLVALQMIIGNILEPKVLGDKIGLHPIVVLLSLTFWGLIWGIPGMFLSIPITATLKIIFQNFQYTTRLADVLEGRI